MSRHYPAGCFMMMVFLLFAMLSLSVALEGATPEKATEALSSTSEATPKKVKVFGLGPGRSGTDSLRLALIRLGFGPTYHMKELLMEESGLPTLKDFHLWRQAARANNDDEAQEHLATILEPWGSGCDWPLNAFPKQLLHIYSDAKFILTVRSPEKWYASTKKTICIFGGKNYWFMPFVTLLPVKPFCRLPNKFHMMEAIIEYVFDGRHDFESMCDPKNRDVVIQWYKDWNAKVVELIPEDQLLVFKTGEDGYEELASFLGVPVPKIVNAVGEEEPEPYPSSNSGNQFKYVLLLLKTIAIMMIMSATAIFFLVLQRIFSMSGVFGTSTTNKQKMKDQ